MGGGGKDSDIRDRKEPFLFVPYSRELCSLNAVMMKPLLRHGESLRTDDRSSGRHVWYADARGSQTTMAKGRLGDVLSAVSQVSQTTALVRVDDDLCAVSHGSQTTALVRVDDDLCAV